MTFKKALHYSIGYRCGLLALLMLFAVSCGFNPFAPKTGEPLPIKSTPQGAIEQLLRSYETKSISEFEKILPADTSFRFYVSPSFFTDYQSNPSGILLYERIDSGYSYVPRGDYHYWGRDDEVKSHRNLFERATLISFTIRPFVDPSKAKYHYNALGDTIGVELLIEEGKFEVQYKESETDFYVISQPVDIQTQVFYLTRNSEGSWIINKWFDFGTAHYSP